MIIYITCFVGFLVSIAIWAMRISNMNYADKITCDETSCFVQVINNVCFAKFDVYPDPNYYKVECDSRRYGVYNITQVPCDRDNVNGHPILRCVKETDKESNIVGIVCYSVFTPVFSMFPLLYSCIVIKHKDFLFFMHENRLQYNNDHSSYTGTKSNHHTNDTGVVDDV